MIKKKILVVDDNLDSCLMLGTILKLENFEVEITESTSIALIKIETSPPDAVITDYRMPDMDGCQFLQHIRASNKHMPVFIVNGIDQEYLRDTAPQCINQISAFIPKPVDPDSLVEIVKKVLNFTDVA